MCVASDFAGAFRSSVSVVDCSGFEADVVEADKYRNNAKVKYKT